MALDSIYAKLDRADAHREALVREIGAFLDGEAHGVSGEFDLDAGRYSLRIAIREQPPLLLSVILGDMLHNLRSALNYLACELVAANGGTPTEATQFPIYTRQPSGDAWLRRVNGIGPAAIDAIRKIQPYETSDRPERTALGVLADLSNQDKHRLPLACIVAIRPHDPESFGVEAIQDVVLGRGEINTGRALVDGDEIAWAEARITGPEPQAQTKGLLPIQVAFGDAQAPLDGLADLCNQARNIVRYLAAFL